MRSDCGEIPEQAAPKQGKQSDQPESSVSQPTPLSFDAPSGGWVELETGNGRFSRELSAAAHVETAAAPVTGRPAAGSQFPDYQEDDADGTDDESESTIPEPQTLDRSGWIMLLVGPIVALACFAFFWLRWTLETFKTLVHEMGHAIFGWLFGYPSFPAFDVIWGGGVTVHTERSTVLCILIYAGFAGLFWVYRKNRATLTVLAALVFLHAVCRPHFDSLCADTLHGAWNRTRHRRIVYLQVVKRPCGYPCGGTTLVRHHRVLHRLFGYQHGIQAADERFLPCKTIWAQKAVTWTWTSP